jgi:hypothetical protein
MANSIAYRSLAGGFLAASVAAVAFAAGSLLASTGAEAVKASPPTCYPAPPCVYCVENEGSRCVKCARKTTGRCAHRWPNRRPPKTWFDDNGNPVR